MKLFIQIFLMFLIITVSANSQSGGINFSTGIPVGEFSDKVDRAGIGISGEFLFMTPTREAPYSLGLNIGFLNYGDETRRERFSSTIPDVSVDVNRSNNIANMHILFKLILPEGTIRPYAEGLFGGSYIFTETKVYSFGSEEIASSTNFDDFSWSYGAGAGFLIDVLPSPEENISNLFLDLKVRYLFGSEAEYLKEGSITIDNGNVYYDVTRSKTDLLTINVGVVAYFTALY